jgi:hypothetical protein
MSQILIQVFYVSKESNSTYAQDECWSVSRRIGMLCYYLNNGRFNLGYRFENGGVVISNFEGRPGLNLVINGQHTFTDPNNFGLLMDYTKNFADSDYEDTLYSISEALGNSGLFHGLQRFKRTEFNNNAGFHVRQSVLID